MYKKFGNPEPKPAQGCAIAEREGGLARAGSDDSSRSTAETDNWGAREDQCGVFASDRLWVRIRCLLVGLVGAACSGILGIVIHCITNSLTVKLDFVNTLSDAVSFAINIGVEFGKQHVSDESNLLRLDLAGSSISLACLLGTMVMGVLNATARAAQPSSPTSRVSTKHHGLMISYSLTCLVVDIYTLCFWWRNRQAMDPEDQPRQDRLNIASGLAHICIGLLTNLGVIFTAFRMFFISQAHESHRQEMLDDTSADLAGTYFLCGCTIVSAAMLVFDARETVMRLCGRSNSEDDGCGH